MSGGSADGDVPKKFLSERRNCVKNIKDFLFVVLNFLYASPQICENIDIEAVAEHVPKLIKSLCLIHALCGYPGEEETRIDKSAVKKLVTELKGKDNKNLLDYCELGPNDDTLWKVESSSLASLKREPAYIFVEMIRDNYQTSSEIALDWLQQLHKKNYLRPEVLAKHKTNEDLCGVSLGSPSFVRPLYLYTKLRQLSTQNSQDIHLEDVKAFRIDKYDGIPPCITCQRFFLKFRSSPMIGNCAEYDVIGNVDPQLLQTEQWQKFESACQQHLDAFNATMRDIKSEISLEETIKTYFQNTRHPTKPKVLQYQCSAETMDGFEIIAMDWPPPKKQ